MVGFVNSLAILIFMAQVPEMHGRALAGLSAGRRRAGADGVLPEGHQGGPGAAGVDRRSSPSSRSAPGIAVPTVGDKGELPSSLPVPGLPDVPFTLDTLTAIAPYALAMALVGLMESLMTAKLVDDITDTHSSKTRESIGQGIANIVTGFFGGMGGCAMIGQTMINVKNGARTRLSTFLAGVFLMVLCIVFGPVVSDIPMAALVAVMVMVSFGTFDWHSIAPATLRRMPAGRDHRHGHHRRASWSPPTTWPSASSSASITAMVIFARRVAHLANVTAVTDPDGDTGRLRGHRRAVLRLHQRPRLPVRLRQRPRQGRHRPVRRPHLGRLLRRRPGRRSRPSTPSAARRSRSSASTSPAPSIHGTLSGELTGSH